MDYRVDVRAPIRKKILSWNLPDSVMVEVHVRLHEQLPRNPTQQLRRAFQPFDGMLFEFDLIDPENRLREHFFVFQVVYSQDERSLIVATGAYLLRDGM